MTIDISSQDRPETNASALASQAPNGFRNLLSAALIILLPSAFWILAFETINYMFLLNFSSETRTSVTMAVLGVFALVWLLVAVSRRKREQQ